ncbi:MULTISPECIES: DUF3923 family protein [Lactobacillaceae]|uniref:DUF3923 family protein n=1 Tax=Lactobacillaceae TaxID=33958 RepID=UPI001CC1D725|nr:DUF3923 family protein [Lentilactobacillus hilgardii]MBZ2202137.1 NADH:ubiquinone oxidoreductase [Lentilactobacillus hilgardii]MBZ2205115.1 DUF3923 domain-containing protein [Lentilactobacillus hilgardii]
MKAKTWWITNSVLLIIFILMAVFMMLRKVDGAGVVQNFQTRIASVSVLGVMLLIIIVVETILLLVSKRRRHKKL